MNEYWVAIGSALWLGILTSISPCPLATNIVAITYIGKRVDRPMRTLLSGIIYTLGRAVAYVAIAALLVSSLLSIPDVAIFLQQNMNKILGPILLVTGLILLNLIPIRVPSLSMSERLTRRVEKSGVCGAGLLGLLFALSFCPVSAGLFFGSLIPLSVKHQSAVVIPTIFGVGTALPVVGAAILISSGSRLIGSVFDKVTAIEKWAQWITGAAFVLIGIYYILVYLVGWQW